MRKIVGVILAMLLLVMSSVSAQVTFQARKEAVYKSYYYESVFSYDKAIELLQPLNKATSEKDYFFNVRLGWLHFKKKNYENSKFHYQRALLQVPTSIEAMLGLSLPMMAMGKWAAVETLMYKILMLDSGNYYGNRRLAEALRQQQKYLLSMKVSAKMLSKYPLDKLFLQEHGIASFLLGEKSAALETFSTLLLVDQDNQVAKYYLGFLK